MADDLPAYRTHLQQQPCACEPCVCAVIVHHPRHRESHAPWRKPEKSLGGKPGKGQKCSDWYALPMCPHHHKQLHRLLGYFKGYTKETLRIWQDKEIDRLQELWWETHDFYPNEPKAKAQRGIQLPKKTGHGWTVALVKSLLMREARHRPADVSAAFLEIVRLIGEDTR